ncbi:MAG: ABC transporter ATP-binding protein [Gammaproteobacteria bacterium]|nr:ABC transporter ATP-binding protein [Gammaproteobacteria bacterium]
MITVDDFHKAYEGTVAVSGMSFEVDGGDILGLVGPNGAGKTTTLKTLSGVIPATRGRLSVQGFDVERDAVQVKRRLAYVPDDPQLFPDLSVDQHLAFTAAVYGVDDADDKAADLVELFELTARRKTPARDLSRGMRQKLAICCAYLHDPIALLFDEPLTGLDPHGIRMLKESIRDRAQKGAAVIVSSHLLAMVEDICTRVLIINAGQQRFCGTLDELREMFASSKQTATLEEAFFLATQEQPKPQRLQTLVEACG